MKKIGIFDSGVGGLTIWKELHQLLPNESTIYLADNKNAPYGEKSKEEIQYLSKKNVEFLIQQEAKLIVVACNTATTNAVDYLRTNYKIPIVGLEPAIKPAIEQTKTKHIGVLATEGTLTSEKYTQSKKQHKNIIFHEQVGYKLALEIEQNGVDSNITFDLLKKYLLPMVENNIDCLVLGCTHYPLLIPQIEKILPPDIKILDSGKAVAQRVKNLLNTYDLANKIPQKTEHQFFANQKTDVIKTIIGSSHKIEQKDF